MCWGIPGRISESSDYGGGAPVVAAGGVMPW